MKLMSVELFNTFELHICNCKSPGGYVLIKKQVQLYSSQTNQADNSGVLSYISF